VGFNEARKVIRRGIAFGLIGLDATGIHELFIQGSSHETEKIVR
jgi:hypothetical protein